MNISKTFISAVALLLSSSVFGQTQVPNTFQSGQPAKAAEVNANFSALEAAINANDSRITANENANNNAPFYVVLDSTGQQVGDGVVSISREFATVPLSVDLSTGETINFFATVSRNAIAATSYYPGASDNVPNVVWFTLPDCVGQGYIQHFGNWFGAIAPAPLMALLVSDRVMGTPAHIWRPTSNTTQLITAVSTTQVDNNGAVVCTNMGNSLQFDAYPVVFDHDLHQLYIPPFTLSRIN